MSADSGVWLGVRNGGDSGGVLKWFVREAEVVAEEDLELRNSD